MATVDIFFSDDYVAAGMAFDTTRKAGLLAANLLAAPIDNVRLLAPTPASRWELERIHETSYVDAVLTGEPRALASSANLGWDPGLATSQIASTGGCLAAARSAWQNGTAGSLSSGLHHARSDTGAGYCTFNGFALAALTFLDLGARHVLLLDLDAHCGGGTNDIVGTDQRITQLDVATDSFDQYQPTGASTLDLVDDADEYLPTIKARLDDLPADGIDAIVYNAGMDPHQDCMIGGLDGITGEMLAEREHNVFGWASAAGLPIAFVLAGGYSAGPMGVDRLVSLHRLTVNAAAHAQPITRPSR